MCNPQIAVVKETKAGTFDHISQAKLHSIIDNILMAFEFVFGCWHRNRSRPFTLSGWTYEVCLNCGMKFAYNRAEINSRVAQCKNLALRSQYKSVGSRMSDSSGVAF